MEINEGGIKAEIDEGGIKVGEIKGEGIKAFIFHYFLHY